MLLKRSLRKSVKFSNFPKVRTNIRWMTNPFLYDLLKIDTKATQQQIKVNYYNACKKYHPDHEGGTTNQFLEINKAFQILNCPNSKQLYDNLDHSQYQEFLSTWKISFHQNKNKIEQLKKFQESKTKKFTGIIIEYFASKLINHYNQAIVYDEKKNEKRSKFNTANHIYFIQDVSSSMLRYDNTDSNFTSIPKEYINRDSHKDGIRYNCTIDYDKKYHHIIKKSIYINKSIKNIKSICQHLKYTSNNYLISFVTFSQYYKKIWYLKPIDYILSNIDNCATEQQLWKNEFTHIYDTIKTSINDVKQNGNLSLTTFIIITDGVDFKSETTIEEVLKIIKDVNIIILTIDVKDTIELQKICRHAKSGKLLEIGTNHDYQFKTMEQAFSETKNLILHNNHVTNINIKKEFDL